MHLPLHNDKGNLRWDCELRAQCDPRWCEEGRSLPALSIFDSVQNALRASANIVRRNAVEEVQWRRSTVDRNQASTSDSSFEGIIESITEGKGDTELVFKEAPATWGLGF